MKRLAVVLAVALVAACADASGSAGSVTATGGSGRPKQIAAVVDEKVVVLSSKNGKVVRTLVEGPDAAGASSVAVSADGELVYFTRDDPVALCGEAPALQIATVPIDGGDVLVHASGRDPIVSPDGERIAYATGGSNQCGPPSQIVVEELDPDAFSQQLIEHDGAPLRPLAWAADDQRILFEALSSAGDSPEVLIADGSSSPSTYALAGTAFAFRGNRVAVALPTGALFRVVVDRTPPAESGVRELFEVDGASPTVLEFDRSGEHLLYIADRTLSQWSGGDRKPKELADGVTDAAWVTEQSADASVNAEAR